MNLISVRIITNDVDRLVTFYEIVSGLSAIRYTEDFAELQGRSCTLAIGSTRTMAPFGDAGIRPGENHSAIIEFLVEDVDKEFERLKKDVKQFVQEPNTMPWGNRSLLFRDPDGNLINFFTPATPEAIKKFQS